MAQMDLLYEKYKDRTRLANEYYYAARTKDHKSLMLGLALLIMKEALETYNVDRIATNLQMSNQVIRNNIDRAQF